MRILASSFNLLSLAAVEAPPVTPPILEPYVNRIVNQRMYTTLLTVLGPEPSASDGTVSSPMRFVLSVSNMRGTNILSGLQLSFRLSRLDQNLTVRPAMYVALNAVDFMYLRCSTFMQVMPPETGRRTHRCDPSVDIHRPHDYTEIRLHGTDHVIGLESYGLQGSAVDMAAVGAPG